jgi:putative inorganic carbon (HCO3(-)) transporter
VTQTLSLEQRGASARQQNLASWGVQVTLRPLQLLIAAPMLLYLAALTAMLLRHPDIRFYAIDRIAFGVLVVAVLGRALVLRQEFLIFERASLPMIGLSLLALISVSGQPFDHETLSLLASKFIVPFALFHLAVLVFTEEKRLRAFEFYSVILLAYLSVTAIVFLCGWHSLILPKFILDESFGSHADRARGPLLQAVANGVSLNILGLVAVHAYSRGSIRGIRIVALIASVPIAILATMTRTVWVSFAVTIVATLFVLKRRKIRLAGGVILVAGSIGLAIAMISNQFGNALRDRLQESGPVEYRQAVYLGAWEMFLERPVLGWGFHEMPGELPRHVAGYREKTLYPHNTYLELLVEHGLVGLALYGWLMYEIWRLGRRRIADAERQGFLNGDFHRIWPIILGVYWINAALVVMSYQFVNALLFTMAGMLAAQRRRAHAEMSC